ncbi:general stress protein [Microbacterium terregens]|uniref:General stress protein n=1 Tax=Microbacterium terregens TaxID=69363 RepID=A0ABV5SXS1_9MICO
MSINGGRIPQSLEDIGQSIASFPTYEAAQKAVSTLIAADIPARDIAIVGQDLRSVERVTGRLGYATAARSGAINGVLLGLLFSAILVIGTPAVPIQAFVGVLFVGIAIGMLFSIITYSFVRRRRDFASVMQVIAEHYEVTVAAASMQRARQVLGGQTAPQPRTPAASADPTPPAGPLPAAPTADAGAEPPRYGERVAPAADDSAEPIPTSPPESGSDAPAGSDVSASEREDPPAEDGGAHSPSPR